MKFCHICGTHATHPAGCDCGYLPDPGEIDDDRVQGPGPPFWVAMLFVAAGVLIWLGRNLRW